MSKQQCGAMLKCIVGQCKELKTIVLKNLRFDLSRMNILNAFQQCKNLSLFVVERLHDDSTVNYRAYWISNFVIYDPVEDGQVISFTATVLSIQQSEDLKKKIENLFWPLSLKVPDD